MGKTVVSSLSPLALSSLFTLTSCQKETTADRKQFHTKTTSPIKTMFISTWNAIPWQNALDALICLAIFAQRCCTSRLNL